MKSVKLRNPSTMFRDPETGFAISGADVVVLGARLGRLTKERLQAGALIIIDEPGKEPEKVIEAKIAIEQTEAVKEEESPDEGIEGQDGAWKFYTLDEIKGMHYFDLIRLADAFGLKYGRNKPKVAQLRDDFMAQQERIKAAL